MEDLLDYKIVRDKHPAVTLYWISESEERGRPVILRELSCMFCKRTLVTDFKGQFATIINAPVSPIGFGMAMTVRCKFCKQNYRFIVVESFLG